MPEYLTPGVYFETVDVRRAGLTAIRTDIAAFVGIAERGPLHSPTAVNSWEQFQAAFGRFLPNGYLAYSVKAFFANGGQTCYVVRVAAPPVSTASDLGAVQPADRNSSIVNSVQGFAAGAVVTVQQGTDRVHDHLLREVDPATRRLSWEIPLEQAFDLSLPIQFSSGASRATGELLDMTGTPTLRIRASSPGAWGNALSVRVTRGTPAATRTSDATQPADRESSLTASVVGFGVGALVQIFQDQTPAPPLVTHRVVAAVDATQSRLRWNTPLDAAYDLTSPIFFETLTFSLSVYQLGRVRELFPDLSLVPTHARYVGQAIAPQTSDLIRVDVLGAAPATAPDPLPNPAAPNLVDGQLALRTGRDGIAALQPEDFTGDPGSAVRRGLRTLENVDEVASVAIADVLIQPVPLRRTAPLPPAEFDPCLPAPKPTPLAPPPGPPLVERAPRFSLEQVFGVQQALVAHCENRRDRLALLDPPVLSAPAAVLDIGEIQSWRRRFDSNYAALYYPWVLVYDPLQPGDKLVRAIPPSGHVLGVYARTDREVGVHKAPANAELRWAQDVSAVVPAATQGVLNPLGINCLRVFPGRGLRVYGARTVSSDAAWRYVNLRRLMMMIEKAVEISIQWTVFEPNDFYLRQTLSLAISSFLRALWERGALVGETADQAFFVKCDEENNPPDLVDRGQLLAEVGVALVYPAEFVIFRIGRLEDELETVELKGVATWSST